MGIKKDYYELLNVNKNASLENIKKAYRELARKYHPDVYKGSDAQTKFKEINEAYQVLSDSKKRAAYDQFGHSAFSAGGAAGSWGNWGNTTGVDFNFDFGNFRDPFDIFEEFFGSRSPFGFDFGTRSSRSSRNKKGSDIYYELTVPFEEAVFGTERNVSLNRQITCPECRGSGAAPGSKKVTCEKCEGRGVVQKTQRSIFGNILTRVACDKCGGEGRIPEKLCSSCKGRTVVKDEKTRQIKIPAGVDDGTVIRYRGLGDVGVGSNESGDLYLTIKVLPSKVYKREGVDIYYELPLSITQAALGDEVFIPTLEGEEKIKVLPGTQPGVEIRLKNKGIPLVNGRGRGDLIARVNVEIPRQLSRKQQELLKEFSRS